VVEPYNGPYDSFRDFYMGFCKTQLIDSEKSPVAAGWKNSNGLRERIDKFIDEKFASVLENATAGAEGDKRCLIVGDFSMFKHFCLHRHWIFTCRRSHIHQTRQTSSLTRPQATLPASSTLTAATFTILSTNTSSHCPTSTLCSKVKY
jgi:hypothetical protein